MLVIGVLHRVSIVLISGFAILGDAVMANVEELTSHTLVERGGD